MDNRNSAFPQPASSETRRQRRTSAVRRSRRAIGAHASPSVSDEEGAWCPSLLQWLVICSNGAREHWDRPQPVESKNTHPRQTTKRDGRASAARRTLLERWEVLRGIRLRGIRLLGTTSGCGLSNQQAATAQMGT